MEHEEKHAEVSQKDMNIVAAEVYYAALAAVREQVMDHGLCEGCYSEAIVNGLADAIVEHILSRGLMDALAEADIVAHRIRERLLWGFGVAYAHEMSDFERAALASKHFGKCLTF